jgi:hypothetical protein
MQNSWGEGWGDNGTIKLAMGSNMCGVANYAFFPHGSALTSNADGNWHARVASATSHVCASPHILMVDCVPAECECRDAWEFQGVQYAGCTDVASPGVPWCQVGDKCTEYDGTLLTANGVATSKWKNCGTQDDGARGA